MSSDLERRPPLADGVGGMDVASKAVEEGRTAPVRPSSLTSKAAGEPPAPAREAPARPTLADKPGAPVLVKLPAPASVRLSQLAWVLSLAVGALAVVYLFVIREPLMPDIVALVTGVEADRAEATYQTAADIIYWSVFGSYVAILLVQVTFLVSFSNRRPNTRWWLLGTVLFQGVVFLVCRELVALGDRGVPLVRLLLLQGALALVALLFAAMPGALRWTARRHDVRRTESTAAGEL